MLLSELVLSKRGPLAKVWLSAHQERKLSKQQTLNVDIEDSCEAILSHETDQPFALRISGQLMLGVTRIYGRQATYLMEDCRETRERITAFQPGIVDLPEDQMRAPNAAITLPQLSEATLAMSAIDMFGWDVQMPAEPQGLHTAPLSRTNLRASREYGAYNFGRPAALSIYGGSEGSRYGSVDSVSNSHLDSHDYQPFDLGLDGVGLDFGDMSMELGRDAQDRGSRSRSPIEHRHIGSDAMDIDGGDMSFAPMDLGLEDLPPLEPMGQGRSSSPASSALTTPPPPSPPPVGVTPRTAKRIADAQAHKVKRVRVMRPDEELELPDEEFAQPDENAEYHVEPRYIPANDDTVHLREVARDPAYFLKTRKDDGETRLFVGPGGLDSALADLFTLPMHALRRPRGPEDAREESPKRPRVDEFALAEFDLEAGRRQSRTPGLDAMFDLPAYDADMSFDLGELPLTPGMAPPMRDRASSLAPSRAESIARAVQYAEGGDHPLALFDGGEASTTQLGSDMSSLADFESTGGFSKTTGMAMGVLRREIEAIEAEATAEGERLDERPTLEFADVAKNSSKRAASQFFFELLVLGTRDTVALKQDVPYGPIEVRAKDKLWTGVAAASD